MQRHRVGTTDIELSAIGLGGAWLGHDVDEASDVTRAHAVLQAVEFSPPTLAPAPAPEAKELPAAEPDRVGEVKVVSKTYGVFVKLDPGLALQPGEEILIFRDGKEVARSRILKVTRGDSAYPDGAAQVQKDESIHKGDEVRRPKP